MRLNDSTSKVMIGAVIALALAFVAIPGAFAFGFFFFPCFFLAAATWLIYRTLIRSRASRPRVYPRDYASRRWADGQPGGEALHYQSEAQAQEARERQIESQGAAEHARINEEAARDGESHPLSDYQGPPPNVPFP
jgi:hypothetical protein